MPNPKTVSPEVVQEMIAGLNFALRYLEHPDVQAIPFACRAQTAANKIRATLAKTKGENNV